MAISFTATRITLAAGAIAAGTMLAGAQEWQTTSSLMGESRYGQDFQRYDHVNPDAPKGGTLNSVATGSFDSFNPYIVRGSPGAGFVQFFLAQVCLLLQQGLEKESTGNGGGSAVGQRK